MRSKKIKNINNDPTTSRTIRKSSNETSIPFCEFENDDTSEKLDRQRNKVQLSEQRQNLLQNSNMSVEKSMLMCSAISGLTNAQMTEHYSNCIKLSSENKITMKNAFNLHLIDYMQNMIKKRDPEIENFQVASCTLDASAKIYASRVDFIYSEAFKVAGGLSRKNEKKTKEQSDEDKEKGEDEDSAPTPVKKRKVRQIRTIEKNVENLNLNKFDDDYTLDPLHQKLRQAFDEGGTNGLLLNTLSIADDSCQLQFDSRTPAFGVSEEKHSRTDAFDLSHLSQAINKVLDPHSKICPYFANFSLINSNDNKSQFLNTSVQENFTFDPEKCTESAGNESDSPLDEGCGECDNFEIGDANSDNGSNEEILRSEKQIDFRLALSTQPSEYSYFDVDFLRSWAGPERWHIAQSSKIATARIQTKQKKEPFFVKFDKEIDWNEELKISKSSKELTKRTMETVWSGQKNILPIDLHYKPDLLRRLFLKPKLNVCRTKRSTEVDDVIHQYDYENANDCDNFCPAEENDHDQSADLFTTKFNSFDETCGTVYNGQGSGDGTLIQQPYKVTKIDIPYARTAKRINVKKVKLGLWKIIDSDENKTNLEITNNGMKFSSLYNELSTSMSGKTLENMSVPIAFVCLLYLANEKNLEITNGRNLRDLLIKQ